MLQGNCCCGISAYVMIADDAIMKTEENPEYVAVEYELPEYPIQMTQERQKQERRVSQ